MGVLGGLPGIVGLGGTKAASGSVWVEAATSTVVLPFTTTAEGRKKEETVLVGSAGVADV